jgi:tripartite-type tricarboxylate transporter receptor subunit TctC
MTSRRRLLLSMLAALPLAARGADRAWPTKLLRIIVSEAAGTVPDVRARWLAERLGPALAQPIVVENKPGAGGSIAATEGARSSPDGYTLMFVHQGTMAINPHLYAKLGYDPLADFAPVARFGAGAMLLAVPTASPVRSVADLIALGKSNPTRFGSSGIGTPPHIASELFVRMAGFAATHIPYKGGAKAVPDLIAGHLDWSIEGTTVLLPQVKAGRLRALAATGALRSPDLPDVPTLAEAGVPGYAYIAWSGVAVPAATPKAIIARLSDEITKIGSSAEGRDWFASFAVEAGVMAPAEFAKFIRDEHARFGKLIHDAGIRIE